MWIGLLNVIKAGSPMFVSFGAIEISRSRQGDAIEPRAREQTRRYPIGQDNSIQRAANSVSTPGVRLGHQFRQWELVVRLR